MTALWRVAGLAAALLLAGCAARRPAARWQVTPVERGHVLVPPRAQREPAEFRLKKARAGGKKNCRIDTREVSLRWRGRDAMVRAEVKSLAPIPGTWIPGTAMPGTGDPVVVASNWFDDVLRPGLKSQAKAGCLAESEVLPLEQRLIDRFSLPSGALYRLRYGEYALRGYVDLEPQFHLRAVEPVREQGKVTGYLTSFYELRAAPKGGVVVSAAGSEANIAGMIQKGQAADSEVLHLPAGMTYLRLFFRSWSISGHRRIALIAAGSAEAREKASAEFETDPEGFCSSAAARGAACVAVPKEMVIGAELRVRANGTDQYVPVGGSVNDLLRSMGVRETNAVLATLAISRWYEGKLVPVEFDRRDAAVLGLVLMGGEEIRW
ncbi:MAG: hypothetical protein HZB13_12020 [Acidobacteria bacterium]|nr:hypothetical protein [Acidobacteriota bacterium]